MTHAGAITLKYFQLHLELSYLANTDPQQTPNPEHECNSFTESYKQAFLEALQGRHILRCLYSWRCISAQLHQRNIKIWSRCRAIPALELIEPHPDQVRLALCQCA